MLKNQLIDDKEEATKKGINVDGILNVLGINEAEWKKLRENPNPVKKKNFLQKIIGAF